MADNTQLNLGTGGKKAATDEVTYSGDTADVQLARIVTVTGAEGSKTVVDLPGDATNGLDVDVTRLPALVAGTANIGDVDVLTVPAPLSVVGTGTEAAAMRVTIATDSTGVLSVDDNGGSLTVDGTVSLAAGAAAIGTVSVTSISAGTNNIGDVDVLTLPNVTLAAGTNTNEVVGDVAHDAPAAGNPVLIAGYASAAAPTSVSADADAVRAWFLRNGAAATVITAAGALVGGDATNGLDVDVTRLPALVAGSANIGDVDVLTVPADPFGANADAASGTGSISAKLRQIAVTGIPVTTLPTLPSGTNNIGDVDVLTMPAVALAAGAAAIGTVGVTSIAAGTNNIGDVDVLTLPNVTLAAGTNTNEVVGDVAHDAPAAGNPLLVAGYASAAAPADVSADADAVRAWRLRNGAAATVLTAAGALVGGDATNGLDVDVTRVPADPFGVNADASSATGSISAKLRFIAATGVPITGLPALPAGTNNIGDVDVLTVPAPLSTTGNGTAATALRVTVASDSTGVIQTTTGKVVTIATDVTRPANTTTYAINDAMADATPTTGGFTLTDAGRVSGGSGIITDATFTFDGDESLPLQGELMLFNQAVTAVSDNAAFAISDAEAKTLIGRVPFTLEDIGNQGWYHAQNLNIGYTCVGTANLRFLVRVKNAFIPVANSSVLTVTIKCMQAD